MRTLFVYKYLTLGGVEAVIRSRLDGLGALGIDASAWFLLDGPGRGLFEGAEERFRVGDLKALLSHLQVVRPEVITMIDTPEVLRLPDSVLPLRKLIVEVHTPYRHNRAYLAFFGKKAPRMFLVPSSYQAALVRKAVALDSPIKVIANPLGRDFADDPRAVLHPPPGPVLCWIGRLDYLKNWKLALSVARRVIHDKPSCEIWMVGSSTDSKAEISFYRRAHRLGLLGKLRWYRDVPHDRMPALLESVRGSGGVVLSTSRGESFGMAVAEAMACGCAVVVPGMGPFPEFVQHGMNGLAYRTGSRKDAAAKVLALLDSPTERERLGARARHDILARHAPDVALAELARALRQAAGGISLQPGTLGAGVVSPDGPISDRGKREELFDGYYTSGFWPGPGSSAEYTRTLRSELPGLLERYHIRTLLDAPCGDFGWFRLVERPSRLTYIGADIVRDIVEANLRTYGDERTRFEVLDITRDPLPEADLMLCRDCLFHFSEEDIILTLGNFLRGGIPYLLTSTHPACQENQDIATGSFRLLNLELPPYRFGTPLERLEDWVEGHPRRQLGLWSREAVSQAVGGQASERE